MDEHIFHINSRDKTRTLQNIEEAIRALFAFGDEIPDSAVIDVLVEHSLHAVKQFGFSKFAIAGGVASNSSLRKAFEQECARQGIRFYHPSPIYCTDNAAMIGVAGYYEYLAGVRHGYDLNAVPNLRLGER